MVLDFIAESFSGWLNPDMLIRADYQPVGLSEVIYVIRISDDWLSVARLISPYFISSSLIILGVIEKSFDLSLFLWSC